MIFSGVTKHKSAEQILSGSPNKYSYALTVVLTTYEVNKAFGAFRCYDPISRAA